MATLSPWTDALQITSLAAIASIFVLVLLYLIIGVWTRNPPGRERDLHRERQALHAARIRKEAEAARYRPKNVADAASHYRSGQQTVFDANDDSFLYGFLAGQIFQPPILFGGPNHVLGMMSAHMMMQANHLTYDQSRPLDMPNGDFTEPNFRDGLAAGNFRPDESYAPGSFDLPVLLNSPTSPHQVSFGSDWGDSGSNKADWGDPSSSVPEATVQDSSPDLSSTYSAPDPSPSFDCGGVSASGGDW